MLFMNNNLIMVWILLIFRHILGLFSQDTMIISCQIIIRISWLLVGKNKFVVYSLKHI